MTVSRIILPTASIIYKNQYITGQGYFPFSFSSYESGHNYILQSMWEVTHWFILNLRVTYKYALNNQYGYRLESRESMAYLTILNFNFQFRFVRYCLIRVYYIGKLEQLSDILIRILILLQLRYESPMFGNSSFSK